MTGQAVAVTRAAARRCRTPHTHHAPAGQSTSRGAQARFALSPAQHAATYPNGNARRDASGMWAHADGACRNCTVGAERAVPGAASERRAPDHARIRDARRGAGTVYGGVAG
jgi:hypothetical protein